ncbi:MAG: hypothetical protein R2681_10125 [Pyrinomonadaceae bacterium]
MSKNAKEALRLLEQSKLMKNSKTAAASLKIDKIQRPGDNSAVTSKAHKPRPNKKRG